MSDLTDDTTPADRLAEADPRDHPAYGHLHSAREHLCVAQMLVPAHWRSDVQVALDIIDQCGSAVCAAQWSRFDQPEYGEPK